MEKTEMNKDVPQPLQEGEAKPAEAGKDGAAEEIGGPTGPEPTRFGDWEKGGRCSDF